MKRSRNNWLGRAVKSSMAAAMFVGLLFPSYQSETVTAADTRSSSEQVLNSLTKEQRDALKKLQVTENIGLQGFNKKDLESDKELSVIVEFKSKPAKVAVLEAAVKGKSLTTGKAKSKVEQEHSLFAEDLKRILPSAKGKSGNAYQVTRHFKTVYNGVSMKLAANEVESLLQSDAVKAVYKSVTFSVEPPVTDDSVKEQESTKRVESIPFLGVDKLHKKGVTGKGVKVGVIDTGIDYTHPDLKDAYKGGYDLVDNDADPMETTYDDWKNSGMPEFNGNLASYYTSHGTHVSGTIAGQAKNTGGVAVIGVAPEASLYGYRVLGPYGTGELEDILAGIEKAAEDDMDVINLSLGANINDPLYPTSTAVNYAVLQGVTAVVSAGNSGSNSYTLGTPGAAALALTVGASSTPIPVAKYTGVLSGSNEAYELSNLFSDFVTDLKVFDNETLEIVDLGVGKETDYANKDVAGKVVFVNTGVIGTQSKTVYAKNHGARIIIAYSNRPNEGPTPFVKEDQNFIPAFSMSYEQGLELKAQLEAGHNKMTFKNFKEVYTEGDKLASFSSRGPSRQNYDIKPEVTAPGVSILSSVPAYAIYKNDPSNYQYAYSRMSGTSMASPHVAGISALLLQANPELQPSDVKTILMNTAKPLTDDYSVFEVGSGRVDPYRAVHAGTMLQVHDETAIPVNKENVVIKEETGGLSFGNYYAGEEIVIEKTVNFTNLEKEKKKFDVDVHFQTDVKGSLDAAANDVKVDVPSVIPVKSVKPKKVPVSIKIPKTAKAGIYEGYLNITNQDNKNEHYRIPFSVRTTEEGFNSTSLSSYAISPPYLHVKRVYQATSNVSLNFNLKAPMKKIDLVLVDGKTGLDLGFIGTIITDSLYDGQTYNVQYAFEGTYFAFTGDQEQPISFKKSYAKPGPYRIKIIGTSSRDQIYTNYNDVYIDHNNPTITTSLDVQESPVIEYLPGQTSVPLQVSVIDEEIEQMKAAGMTVTQANNRLNYSINGNYNPVLPLGEDGTIDLSVPMNEASPFLRYTLNGLDTANNSTEKKNYYFIKAGSPYGYMKTDKKNVKMGDTVSVTLVLNNVDNLKEAEWTLSNIGQSFEIIDAKPHEALADYGAAEVEVETTGNTSKVKMAMDGTKPVSGNIPAINLSLKVKDAAFTVSAAVNPTVFYTNELGTRISLSSAGMEWMIQPVFSEVYGTLKAEAIAYNADWRKLGVSIRLIDTSGTEYDGSSTLVIFGDYRISKLPVTDKPFVWELTLPGHFTMKREIPVGVEKKGVVWGQQLQYFNDRSVAGDVNQDDVIDIRDALAIQQAWNTNDRASDINFDGVVNAKDMQFVVSNYLKQNLDTDNPPVPVEEADGKRLEDILKELQISA
jgi:subtilisin family serine protease